MIATLPNKKHTTHFAKGFKRDFEPLQTEKTLERGENFLAKIRDISLTKRAITPSIVDRFELVDYNDYRSSIDGVRRHQYRFAVPLLNEDGATWQFVVESDKDYRGYAYLSPQKNGNRAYFPPVPVDIRKAISDRYGIKVPLEGSFWAWLRNHPEIPVFVTEGAGKSLSALSHGYVAIALYGCSCLASPDLIPFLKDRDVYIALDADSKPKAKQAVNRSLSKHLKPLSELAKSVKVVTWDSKNKGLDDLLANLGVEALEEAIACSIDADTWLFEHEVEVANARLQAEKIHADLELDELPPIEQLSELLSKYRDIFIDAEKGIGKSILGGAFVGASDFALLPTPLESLARNNSERFEGVDYRTDCDRANGKLIGAGGYVSRLSFCTEAIQALKDAIESMLNSGASIFNDELNLQTNSLATSSTHGQDGKRKMNAALYWRMQMRGKHTLSVSADLTTYEAKLWEENTGRKPFVIRVKRRKKSYLCQLYFDKVRLKAKLDKAIEAGDRVIISCSRKSDAKFLEWVYRDYGAIAVHRDNANELKFKGFFENPDQWLEENKPQILIVSPVLRSGFSITYPAFDKVFCFFEADSISASTALQLSERYRLPVPRYIFAAKSNHKFTHTTPEAILTTSRFRAKASQNQDAPYLEETDPYLHYQAADNWSRAHFRADIVARLRDEVESVQIDKTHAPKKDRDALRVLLTDFEAWQREQLHNARNLTKPEYEALKDRRDLLEADLLAKQKYELANWSDRAPETVTIEQIERDKKGRKRKALERLERQAYPELARAADKKSIDLQSRWGYGISPQDVSHHALTQRALELLGTHEFLDFALSGDSWTHDTEIVTNLANRLRANRNAERDGKIVDALAEAGIHLPCGREGSNNAYVGALLKWLGLSTVRSQISLGGDRISVYRLCQADLKITRDELTRRAERAIREGLELVPSHPFVEKLSSLHTPFVNADIERCVQGEDKTEIPGTPPDPEPPNHPKSQLCLQTSDTSPPHPIRKLTNNIPPAPNLRLLEFSKETQESTPVKVCK